MSSWTIIFQPLVSLEFDSPDHCLGPGTPFVKSSSSITELNGRALYPLPQLASPRNDTVSGKASGTGASIRSRSPVTSGTVPHYIFRVVDVPFSHVVKLGISLPSLSRSELRPGSPGAPAILHPSPVLSKGRRAIRLVEMSFSVCSALCD